MLGSGSQFIRVIFGVENTTGFRSKAKKKEFKLFRNCFVKKIFIFDTDL